MDVDIPFSSIAKLVMQVWVATLLVALAVGALVGVAYLALYVISVAAPG